MAARKIVAPPKPKVIGDYSKEWNDHYVERRGKLDLKFCGIIIGVGEYYNKGRNVKTTVTIYLTLARNLVYAVKQTRNVGTADEFTESFADAFVGPNAADALKQYITETGKRRYGQATHDAWMDTCEALDLPDEADAEIID